MSKQDFELIAQAISKIRNLVTTNPVQNKVHEQGSTFALDLLVAELQAKLSARAPRFDEQRFWEACQ